MITDFEAQKFIAEIVNRTRTHPEIARGVSVRGTIAFAEIMKSLALLHGGLNRTCIYKAALITLPPRISLKQKGDAKRIILQIVEEVLNSESDPSGMTGLESFKAAAPKSIRDKLDKLHKNAKDTYPEDKQENSPEIIKASDRNEISSRNARGKNPTAVSSSSGKGEAIQLNNESLEIPKDALGRPTEGVGADKKGSSQARMEMSGMALVGTIMEIMDAQDQQWRSYLDFSSLFTYYHFKAFSEKADINPAKNDYAALKGLISDLEKQKILISDPSSSGFLMTGLALDSLLKILFPPDAKERKYQGQSDRGDATAHERSPSVRRYTSGDTFRDVSRRHTLREIVKQRKGLSQVKKGDFRVFLKHTRRPQSDIILCIDSSCSMKANRKMVHARMVAAGLIQSAIEKGDQVGIVSFNNHGQVTLPLSNGKKQALLDCIAGLPSQGNTNIGDGIKASRELLMETRNRNRKSILLISDGQPTAVSEKIFAQLKTDKKCDATQESVLMEVRQAVARGIQVSVVHIAAPDEKQDAFMQKIAKVGSGKVHRIAGTEDLKKLLNA
jgi:Mg-chelatase subunit ChlD